MRKNIIISKNNQSNLAVDGGQWMDLEQLIKVEISSEDKAFPVEGALSTPGGQGWRAAEEGSQTIRIIFDAPQNLSSICLVFEEKGHARTQEFVLRWSAQTGQPMMEIVRQQFNFSPDASTVEKENYILNLKEVKIIELHIVPDIANPHAFASISSLKIA